MVQREVFGPVVSVQRFSDEDQPLAWASDDQPLTPAGTRRSSGRCHRGAGPRSSTRSAAMTTSSTVSPTLAEPHR